jgi:hypothetical protein
MSMQLPQNGPILRSLRQPETLTGNRLGTAKGMCSPRKARCQRVTARLVVTLDNPVKDENVHDGSLEAGNATIPGIWVCGKWDSTCGKICSGGKDGLQATIRPTLVDLVPLMVQCRRNVRHWIRYHGAQADQCVLGWNINTTSTSVSLRG